MTRNKNQKSRKLTIKMAQKKKTGGNKNQKKKFKMKNCTGKKN